MSGINRLLKTFQRTPLCLEVLLSKAVIPKVDSSISS